MTGDTVLLIVGVVVFAAGVGVGELLWRAKLRREWRAEMERLKMLRAVNHQQSIDQVRRGIEQFRNGTDRGDYDAELAILAAMSAALAAFVVYWATSAGVL